MKTNTITAMVHAGLGNTDMGSLVQRAIAQAQPCRVAAAVPMRIIDGQTVAVMLIIEQEVKSAD